MDFGGKLKRLRKLKDISQDQLSKILEIGKTNIARYETNKQTPSAEILKKLADYFGVSADYFLYNENEKNIPSSRIKNKKLLEQFEEVDKMNDYYQNLVLGLIECVIAKQKIDNIVKKQ